MSETDTIDISIVVPCYQDANHLRSSVTKIFGMLNKTRYSFEMIFVDDCSKDNSREVILSICDNFPNTRHLFHEKNVGRGGTFLDGVKLAQGKYIGFLDIDLEVNCIYLLDVISALEAGYHVAIVHRHYALIPSPVFVLRHILSVGYKMLIQKYIGIPKMDTETGFKFFTKECILDLSGSIRNKKWFFDTEVMVYAHKKKYRIKEIDGLFMRNKDKTTTVRIIHDTFEYFAALIDFKKRLKKEGF